MEPQILRLTGVEVQIELYRGATNTFDAYLTYATGQPVNLDDPAKRVILTVADKVVNGTLKYAQINESGTHLDGPGGRTRFSIPPSVTAGLTDERSYTWKYLIVMEDVLTGSRYPFFHGDMRVLVPNTLLAAPAAPIPPTPEVLGVSVSDAVGLSDSPV
jgi:hypothetical protein